VQSGGWLSYGSDLPDMYRRAGVYIDKILKGASLGRRSQPRSGRLDAPEVSGPELVINPVPPRHSA
jgi:hypothetical protein